MSVFGILLVLSRLVGVCLRLLEVFRSIFRWFRF